jgi:hypothetical protein
MLMKGIGNAHDPLPQVQRDEVPHYVDPYKSFDSHVTFSRALHGI